MPRRRIYYAAGSETDDPVEDAQIDLRILSSGLLLALLCCLLSQVLIEASATPTASADSEPRRRRSSMKFSLPLPLGNEEWFDNSYGNPLVAENVELFVLVNGVPLCATPTQITRDSQLRQEWKADDFLYGLYSRVESIGTLQHLNDAGSFESLPIEALQIELTCEFDETFDRFPLELTSYLRVTTPKPPSQVPRQLVDFYNLIAQAADEDGQTLFDWPIELHSMAGITTTLEPEAISHKQLLPILFSHPWLNETCVYFGTEPLSLPASQKWSELARQLTPALAPFLKWSNEAGAVRLIDGVAIGDVPSLKFDFRSDVKVELVESDGDAPFVPKITQSVRPTGKMPAAFGP